MATRLAADAGGASAWYAFAGQKLAAGDVDGAIDAYAQSLSLEPHNAAATNNLGVALIKAGRLQEAISSLERALVLQPGYPRALANLGKALRETGRIVEAIAHLRDALAREPHQVSALVNLGDALAAAGELDEAQRTLERAITLMPTLVEAHMTLGIVHLQAGQVSKSISALRTAVALAPDHADAHSNLAHALFFSGDWEGAWPHFEYRFQRHAHRSRVSPPTGASRWDGALTLDQELWLIGEQGLGDQLQFARYAKALSSLGIRCVLACDPRLVALLSAAGLASRVVPVGTSAGPGSARWVPLLSLPAWHRSRPDSVPFPGGYLIADPLRVKRWSERLEHLRGVRVALAWAGNPRMETGRYCGRSPPLAALAPLMGVPKVRFISLQKHVGEDQLDAVSFGNLITRLPELDPGPDAFLDTAAALKCVDLLVTSDTAIAHLSGALGVPTWLCLAREPDWRWMGRGDRTPWYGSVRLFRQAAPGDWASVYTEVARELTARASEC